MTSLLKNDIKILIAELEKLLPLTVVQGDAAQHLNPHARQFVNSNCAWAVTNSEKSAHKIKKSLDIINSTVKNIKNNL